MKVELTKAVCEYLRAFGRWHAESDSELVDDLGTQKGAAWDRLTEAEKSDANEVVKAVIGPDY